MYLKQSEGSGVRLKVNVLTTFYKEKVDFFPYKFCEQKTKYLCLGLFKYAFQSLAYLSIHFRYGHFVKGRLYCKL